MTKRFTYVKNNSITQYQALPIQEIGKGKAFHCQGIVDKLNKLSDENEHSFNRQSMSSFKILKKSEDRSFEYICNTGYYKFRTNIKYPMIRGYCEPSYDKGLIPKLGRGLND